MFSPYQIGNNSSISRWCTKEEKAVIDVEIGKETKNSLLFVADTYVYTKNPQEFTYVFSFLSLSLSLKFQDTK